MDARKLALAAHMNAGLGIMELSLNKTRGANNHSVSNITPVIDLAGNGPILSGGVPRSVRQIMVNDGNDSS